MQAHPKLESQRRERAVCNRMIMLSMCMILGFTGISVRLWWLQVRKADELAEKAAKLRLDKVPTPSLRGSIFDRNGELLVQDRTETEFYVDKKHLEDVNFVRPRLASLQKVSQTTLKKTMTDDQIIDTYRTHIIAKLAPRLQMPEEDLLKVLQPGGIKSPVISGPKPLLTEETYDFQKFIAENKVGCVYPKPEAVRFRPASERLIHVLGYVSKKQLDKDRNELPRKGVEGIEQRMNDILSGVDGWEYIERDAKRREMPGFAGAVQPPQHGHHIVLTIDMHAQLMLENELAEAYKEHSPNKIMAVLVEPSTGSILAMASEPRAQINKKGETEHRNMALTDVYEPGSTMKIITLTGGIDTGAVTLNTEFFCHNGFYHESNEVEVRDDESLGTLTVKGILTHSSNIGAYQVAKRLGSERFHDYITRFGFGERTALNMPREAKGKVYPLKDWRGSSLSRIAMGYKISVTPLQMAMAVSAIANKGKLMQPRLVDRVWSYDRSETEIVPPVEVRQVCSPATARAMTEALENVVIEGTGKKAQIEGVRVAGKTGTAQRCNPDNGRYQHGHYVVSFVGFAPVESPKVAAVIIIDDPKSENKSDLYGGKLAAPLFARVMKNALDLLNTTPVASAPSAPNPPQGGHQ